MQRDARAMQDRSGAGLVPAEQAERLHLLEDLEPSAGRRMDHAEETAVIECVAWTHRRLSACNVGPLTAVPCIRLPLA